MRSSGWIEVSVAVLFTLISAGTAAAKEVKPPPELVVSVAIGPDTTLDGPRAYIEAITPGGGAQAIQSMRQALAEAVGLKAFDGLDVAATTYLLLVDGKGSKGAALLAKVSDLKRLMAVAGSNRPVIKHGWALIGAKPVVARVSAYAFGSLAGAANVAQPTATMFTEGALGRYRKQVADARARFIANAAAMSEQMGSFFDGMVSAIGDSDRVIVTVDVSKTLGAIDLAIVPHASTRLATFVAAQHPSDYALVDKLPAGPATMLFAGHFEAGPYRQAMLDTFSSLSGTMPKEMLEMWSALMTASSGDLAVAGQIGAGMSMTQVLGLADRKGFDSAVDRLSTLLKDGHTFDMLGIKQTIKTASKADYGDIPLRGFEITYDLSGATAEVRRNMERMAPNGKTGHRVATLEQLGVVVMGPDSQAEIKRAVDAARGKGSRFKPSATIADFIAASRTRKESAAMAIDFGAMMKLSVPLEVMMSLGFADGSAHLRLAIRPDLWRVFMTKKLPAPSGPT